MKRPQMLRIFGKPYHLTYVRNTLESDALGICKNSEGTIAISEDQSPAEEFDTVLHELFHAISYVMSIGFTYDQEEMVVRKYGTALAGILVDNPALLQYICHMAKTINDEIHTANNPPSELDGRRPKRGKRSTGVV